MDAHRETEASATNAAATGKWIVVSLPTHEISVVGGGTVFRTITHFSTGRQGHLTPVISNGAIDPDRRYRTHRSSTYKDGAGQGASMPFALFFQGGCAFHAGDPDVESHGCIHLQPEDAEWLFGWVGRDTVHVRILGPRPATSVQRA